MLNIVKWMYMKRLFPYLTFLLLFAAVIGVQYFSDIDKCHVLYTEPLVLRPEIVRATDLGLHNAAADFEWLAAIQYFGGAESENYEKLDDYLTLSTNLDPKFAYPYAFGALILPTIKEADAGIALGQKGVENGVRDYRIPYYTATTYHFNKNDYRNAAKYFDIAANSPDVPEGIKKVASKYGSNPDKRAQTKQIWAGIYESTNDEVVQERAKKYIVHFEIMDFLDQASSQYFKVYNKHPLEANDLVIGNILREIPSDPFGFQYIFDEDGKAKIKS